jgi:hypothetical protein
MVNISGVELEKSVVVFNYEEFKYSMVVKKALRAEREAEAAMENSSRILKEADIVMKEAEVANEKAKNLLKGFRK